MLKYTVPKLWTNKIDEIAKAFPQTLSVGTKPENDGTLSLILFHRPLSNTSELLKIYQGEGYDLILESWVKNSGDSIEADMLSLYCMLADKAQPNRNDILNPQTALKPSGHDWVNSEAINAQISIMCYSFWLSKWFQYRTFFSANNNVFMPLAYYENYLTEFNLIVDRDFLVTIQIAQPEYRMLLWDVNLLEDEINHTMGSSGYLEQTKIKTQISGVNPSRYAQLQPADNLNIIYNEGIRYLL